MVTKEKLRNSIIRYMDDEVMPKLPTSGKWIVGTACTIATKKYDNIMAALMTNPMVSSLGLVSENGLIDEQIILDALHDNAKKYGSIMVSVPVVGKLTFDESDVHRLRQYLEKA